MDGRKKYLDNTQVWECGKGFMHDTWWGHQFVSGRVKSNLKTWLICELHVPVKKTLLKLFKSVCDAWILLKLVREMGSQPPLCYPCLTLMAAKWMFDLLIKIMITDRIGQHQVLLPISYSYNKICRKMLLLLLCFGGSKHTLCNREGLNWDVETR